jgi:hypothetical protein
MKRQWLFAWLLSLLVLGGLTAGCLRLPQVTVTAQTVARITRGMTLQEVEAILGGPAGDYTDGTSIVDYQHKWENTPWTWRTWDGAALVYFDKAGHVVEAAYLSVYSTEPSWVDRLRLSVGIKPSVPPWPYK